MMYQGLRSQATVVHWQGVEREGVESVWRQPESAEIKNVATATWWSTVNFQSSILFFHSERVGRMFTKIMQVFMAVCLNKA